MMGWSLIFNPLAPVWLLAGLAALCAVIGAILIWQIGLRALWRTAAFAVLLLALANPMIEARDTAPLADVAVVVVDESASQSIKPRTQQRIDAEAKLKAAFKTASNLDVRWVRIKQREGSTGTRIMPAIKDMLRDVPPDRFAGAIILSDGQVHDDVETLKLTANAPVHVLLTGKPGERDRRLTIKHAPKFGIVGEDLSFSFRVDEEGLEPGAASVVDVALKRDGKLTRTLKAEIGKTIELKLKIEHAGLNVIELLAASGPSELTTRNNRALISIQGIRDRLRVLLVSGEPHQGERTWRNLLKADAAVDLVHFTILRPPEKQDGTPIRELSLIAFPTRQLFSEKLHEFDLIIFDRYQRRGVLPLVYLANVADYVDKGGAVLAAAGPAFASPFSLYRTPLASILPGIPTGAITAQGYRAKVTQKGLRHPVTAELPGAGNKDTKWGRWFRLIDAEPVGGETVMSGAGDKPLLRLRRQGKGRVALLLSDHAWLWARGYDGGGPYAELLRRLSHWLMKEPDLEEERLITTATSSELTIERRTMKDETDPVRVIRPSGETQDITLKNAGPGVFRGTVKADETGLYRLESGELSTVAAIGVTDLQEWSDVRSTGQYLSTLTSAMGGGVHRLWQNAGEAARLPQIRYLRAGRRMTGDGWFALQRNNISRTLALRNIPLFGLLAVIAALLALMGLVWYREGR